MSLSFGGGRRADLPHSLDFSRQPVHESDDVVRVTKPRRPEPAPACATPERAPSLPQRPSQSALQQLLDSPPANRGANDSGRSVDTAALASRQGSGASGSSYTIPKKPGKPPDGAREKQPEPITLDDDSDDVTVAVKSKTQQAASAPLPREPVREKLPRETLPRGCRVSLHRLPPPQQQQLPDA